MRKLVTLLLALALVLTFVPAMAEDAIQIGVGGDDAWSRIVTHEPYLPHEPCYAYGFILGAVTADGDPTALAREWRSAAVPGV